MIFTPISFSLLRAARSQLSFRSFHAWEAGNDGIHFGHPEELMHTAANADGEELYSAILTVDKVVDDGAHACRIHVGNRAEVHNDCGRKLAVAELCLQIEKIVQRDRSVERDDRGSRSRAIPAADDKRVISEHGGISV